MHGHCEKRSLLSLKKFFAGGRVCPNHREIGRQRTAMLWLQSASHRKRLHTESEKTEVWSRWARSANGRTLWVTTRPAQKPQQQPFCKILCADMCAGVQHCTTGAGHFAAKNFLMNFDSQLSQVKSIFTKCEGLVPAHCDHILSNNKTARENFASETSPASPQSSVLTNGWCNTIGIFNNL